MKALFNYVKIKEVKQTSKCGSVTWIFPLLLYVGFYNPFNPKPLVNPWFGIIPAGGFHFLGLRVTWGIGSEIREKRIIHFKN